MLTSLGIIRPAPDLSFDDSRKLFKSNCGKVDGNPFDIGNPEKMNMWRFPKMVDPQVTMAFNTKIV